MYIRCQSLKIIFSVSKDFQLFGEAKEGYYGLLWKLAYSHSYIHTKINTYIHLLHSLNRSFSKQYWKIKCKFWRMQNQMNHTSLPWNLWSKLKRIRLLLTVFPYIMLKHFKYCFRFRKVCLGVCQEFQKRFWDNSVWLEFKPVMGCCCFNLT